MLLIWVGNLFRTLPSVWQCAIGAGIVVAAVAAILIANIRINRRTRMAVCRFVAGKTDSDDPIDALCAGSRRMRRRYTPVVESVLVSRLNGYADDFFRNPAPPAAFDRRRALSQLFKLVPDRAKEWSEEHRRRCLALLQQKVDDGAPFAVVMELISAIEHPDSLAMTMRYHVIRDSRLDDSINEISALAVSRAVDAVTRGATLSFPVTAFPRNVVLATVSQQGLSYRGCLIPVADFYDAETISSLCSCDQLPLYIGNDRLVLELISYPSMRVLLRLMTGLRATVSVDPDHTDNIDSALCSYMERLAAERQRHLARMEAEYEASERAYWIEARLFDV